MVSVGSKPIAAGKVGVIGVGGSGKAEAVPESVCLIPGVGAIRVLASWKGALQVMENSTSRQMDILLVSAFINIIVSKKTLRWH